MGLVNIIICSKERSNDKGWLSCRKSQSNVTSSRLLLCLFVRQALCGTVDVDSEYEWTTMIDGWQWQKQKIMKGWKRLSLDSVVEKAALFFQIFSKMPLRSCTSRWPWLRNYLSYLSIVSKNSIIISITDIVSLARAATTHQRTSQHTDQSTVLPSTVIIYYWTMLRAPVSAAIRQSRQVVAPQYVVYSEGRQAHKIFGTGCLLFCWFIWTTAYQNLIKSWLYCLSSHHWMF